MKHMILFIIFTTICLSSQVFAETSESRDSDLVSEPSSVEEYIAEFRRMGSECQSKLDSGAGAGRLWRTCANICTNYADQLIKTDDPERALRYAKKGMVKCVNNYEYTVDYEKKMKK